MTEMDLDRRTAVRQHRWRRLSRIVSGSLGVAAVGGAVWFGVTGPTVSPVQAPAAAAAVAPAQPDDAAADDAAADDPGPTRGDAGRRGDRGAGFDGGRRR